MKRNEIKNILRENLLLMEKEPDNGLVDAILDKINEKGQQNLSDAEKRYLEQTSEGDVDPELENEVQEMREKEEMIRKKIKSGKSVSRSTLEQAPQGIIDDYMKKRLEEILKGEKKFVDIKELQLASQDIIDEYIMGFAEKKEKVLPRGFYKIATQSAVDKAIMNILRAKDQAIHFLVDIIGLGSEHVKDEYVKQAAEEGTYVEPELINNVSEEMKEYYIKKMSEKKGKDVINRMYLHRL